jgi:hypothetical protein
MRKSDGADLGLRKKRNCQGNFGETLRLAYIEHLKRLLERSITSITMADHGGVKKRLKTEARMYITACGAAEKAWRGVKTRGNRKKDYLICVCMEEKLRK